MKRILKKHIAKLLVFVMVLSMLPNSMVQAQEISSSEEMITELSTDKATSEVTTETSSEEVSTEATTEISITTTTEVPEEDVEVTTEATTEVLIEEPTTEVAPEEKEVLPEETTEEIIQKEVVTEELISEQALVDGDKRTVYNDGNWGDGYRWYIIDDDGSKHYVFCLNHGMTMTSGIYEGMITTLPYQSSFDVFRVATAIAYFDAKGDYATTQRVIWNMTPDTASKNLMAYINYAWELTEVNEERAASSASYSASLIPILKRQAFDSTVLQHWNTTRSKNYIATDTTGKGTRTFTMYGNAWKYFAKNGWIQGALVDMDGNTYRNGSVSVATNGSVTVSYTATEGKGDSISTPLAAVFSIKYPYYGSNSYTMLKTPDGIQDLTYSAPKNAPGYFTFLFYTKETSMPDFEFAEVKINKVDEYGTFVSGATFLLESSVAEPTRHTIGSQEDVIEIKEQGTYRLTEVATPGADYKLSNQVITFTAREIEENGVTKIMLTDSNGLYSNQAS